MGNDVAKQEALEITSATISSLDARKAINDNIAPISMSDLKPIFNKVIDNIKKLNGISDSIDIKLVVLDEYPPVKCETVMISCNLQLHAPHAITWAPRLLKMYISANLAIFSNVSSDHIENADVTLICEHLQSRILFDFKHEYNKKLLQHNSSFSNKKRSLSIGNNSNNSAAAIHHLSIDQLPKYDAFLFQLNIDQDPFDISCDAFKSLLSQSSDYSWMFERFDFFCNKNSLFHVIPFIADENGFEIQNASVEFLGKTFSSVFFTVEHAFNQSYGNSNSGSALSSVSTCLVLKKGPLTFFIHRNDQVKISCSKNSITTYLTSIKNKNSANSSSSIIIEEEEEEQFTFAELVDLIPGIETYLVTKFGEEFQEYVQNDTRMALEATMTLVSNVREFSNVTVTIVNNTSVFKEHHSVKLPFDLNVQFSALANQSNVQVKLIPCFKKKVITRISRKQSKEQVEEAAVAAVNKEEEEEEVIKEEVVEIDSGIALVKLLELLGIEKSASIEPFLNRKFTRVDFTEAKVTAIDSQQGDFKITVDYEKRVAMCEHQEEINMLEFIEEQEEEEEDE